MTATTHHQPLPIPPGYHACRACGSPYTSNDPYQETCNLCSVSGRRKQSRPIECNADGCTTMFVPVDRRNRYCCNRCAQRTRDNRKARG